MKALLSALAFVLWLVPSLATVTAATARGADTPAEMAADFAWFGSLGYRDVQGLPFIRAIVNWSFGGLHSTPEPGRLNGFLLEDKDGHFRMLTLDFREIQIEKASKNGREDCSYEPADLRAYSEAVLAGPATHWALGARAHLFVLAWMCARQGQALHDLPARLYAAAQTASGYKMGGQRDPTREEAQWTLRSKLERDLGHLDMWRIIVAFGDPRVTRRELLARLRALPGHFPHCDYLPRAAGLADLLEKMIAEDEVHPVRSDAEIAALPLEEQVSEWIFRLRDQNGVQDQQPGWVNIFTTLDGRQDSPAHHLVQLGDAAVPTLMAALTNPRLTRSVGYDRSYYFSHQVITIGDAALKIIERIAGRSFYRSGHVQGMMALDGHTEAVLAAVERWWTAREK